MSKKVKVTIIDKKGHANCPKGHKVGDIFIIDGKTPNGLCGSVFSMLWPDIKMLLNTQDKKFEGSKCCPDPDRLLEYGLELTDDTK